MMMLQLLYRPHLRALTLHQHPLLCHHRATLLIWTVLRSKRKKAAKKARQALKKTAPDLQPLAEQTETDTDADQQQKSRKEIVFDFMKLHKQLEVVDPNQTSSASRTMDASHSAIAPPVWSPSEEAWIRKKIADREKQLAKEEANAKASAEGNATADVSSSPVSGEGGTEAGANVKTECFCRWCKTGPITKKQEFLLETSDGSWLDCTWGR